MEANAAKKLPHQDPRDTNDEFYSDQDMSGHISLSQHSFANSAQQLSAATAGARRRHPSPHHIECNSDLEPWNGASSTLNTFPMTNFTPYKAYSTPDKDDHHRGDNGSSLLSTYMRTHTQSVSEDPLASPGAYAWQRGGTPWFEAVTCSSSLDFSPPVLHTNSDTTGPTGHSSSRQSHISGVQSVTDYSSESTFLPLPPPFGYNKLDTSYT